MVQITTSDYDYIVQFIIRPIPYKPQHKIIPGDYKQMAQRIIAFIKVNIYFMSSKSVVVLNFNKK